MATEVRDTAGWQKYLSDDWMCLQTLCCFCSSEQDVTASYNPLQNWFCHWMSLVGWALLLISLVLGFFPLPFFVSTILRGTKATTPLEGKLENLHTARSPSFLGVLYRNIISFHTGAIAEGKRKTPLKMLIKLLCNQF